MSRAAIYEPAITQMVAEARAAIEALREAEDASDKLEKRLGETREAAKARRLDLGLLLRRARETLPARGTNTNGWMAYLEAIEMPETTAYRYMQEAGAVSDRTNPQSSNVGNSDYTDVPPPSDDDVPGDGDVEIEIVTDETEVEIDRDTWCTPKWITEAIGKWDLDPCANERSHVDAAMSYHLDNGQDGLALAAELVATTRVFVNPPYSDVRPWIDAYAHTRFCFLLKFDPSTAWFAALLEHTAIVLLPAGERVQFEAPEGVPPKKALANQFPHALFYARAADATAAIKKLCFTPWRIR